MKKYLLLLALLPLTTFASFDTNLKYGARGTDVAELQDFLSERNCFTGEAAGYFGLKTLKAVQCFQTAEEITPVSGYFGMKSRERANAILSVFETAQKLAELQETGTVTPAVVQPPSTDNKLTNLILENQKLNAQLLLQTQIQQYQQAQLSQIITNTQEQQTGISIGFTKSDFHPASVGGTLVVDFVLHNLSNKPVTILGIGGEITPTPPLKIIGVTDFNTVVGTSESENKILSEDGKFSVRFTSPYLLKPYDNVRLAVGVNALGGSIGTDASVKLLLNAVEMTPVTPIVGGLPEEVLTTRRQN